MTLLKTTLTLSLATLLSGCAAKSPAPTAAPVAAAPAVVSTASLLEKARRSLVTVQYTFDNEMGKREFSGTGVVVRADGLVAVPVGLIPLGLPDAQLTDFKVILPPGVEGPEIVELPAQFIGRDERSELAFVKVQPGEQARTFTAIEFSPSQLSVGDELVSIGLLPKSSGYAPFARRSTVAAKLRGPVPMVMSGSGLAGVGALVYDSAGKVVGLVPDNEGQSLQAGARAGARGQEEQAMETLQLQLAPIFFVPIDDYLVSLNDPPVAENLRKRPWIGVGNMRGLEDEVAAFYGLKGVPAVQVADVIPGFAADAAGIKSGDVIARINGQPLERGDQPEELPMILQRKLVRMNVGDTVTFSVISKPGEPPHEVNVTLAERPMLANRAERAFFEDTGFSVRDLVFDDTYARKLDRDFKGVVVAFIRPQSSAQAGQLQRQDIVTRLNQTPVQSVQQFKQAYEELRTKSPGEAVVLEVFRNTGTQIVRIQPPQ